jgi:hypothetical protein
MSFSKYKMWRRFHLEDDLGAAEIFGSELNDADRAAKNFARAFDRVEDCTMCLSTQEAQAYSTQV